MDIKTGVSIIVPTYKEAENLPTLIDRIAATKITTERPLEVLIVDDASPDNTESIVKLLMQSCPWLKFISRRGQKKGLSRSILEGFNAAKYPLLIAMDADLSHPPEKIPELLAELDKPDTDFVIGSRFVKGGSSEAQRAPHRKLISLVCAIIAQLALPSAVKDPLAGFFGLKNQTFQQAQAINPIGWKLGIELIVKCHCQKITEIPIHFSERVLGKSKLTLATGIAYLAQMINLIKFRISSKSSVPSEKISGSALEE